VEDKAPSATIVEIDNQVRRILRLINLLKLNRVAREALADLKQVLIDARIYTVDYEVSETRQEQIENAVRAKQYLEQARKDILTASESDVFNAVDVAQMTAQIDHIISRLK
jgi:hypothetical protein